MTLYGYSREPREPDPIEGADALLPEVPRPREADEAWAPPADDTWAAPVVETDPDAVATGVVPAIKLSTAEQRPVPAPATEPVAQPQPDAEPPGQTALNPADFSWPDFVDPEEPEIPEWDRRPLMIVLAAGAALVLLAVLSGVASAAIFRPTDSPASWRGPQPTGQPTGSAPGGGPAEATITLSGVGDVIMGTQPGDLPPNGGNGFFDPVKDALAADLVMGNLETPLTDSTGRVKCPAVTPPATPSGCFQFYLPPSYANHLRAGGFGLMNLANNHTNDMGPDGLTNTRKALDAAGVKHTGAPNQITYVDVKGVKVAVLGFAVYSWGQNLNNIPAAAALVRKAAAEADIVVIQMQGGAEGSDKTHVKPGKEIYLGEDRGDLMAFSRAVIDAGADVVFGHGPHVMRGMEFYKGRLIAYSLGNFCGYGVLSTAGYLGVGGVLKVTLKRDGTWAGGQLVATEMVRGGLPAVDAEKRALPFVSGLSKQDFGANAAAVSTTDGTISAPAAG